jgi:phytoene dehydrogenase-like protein
MHTQKPRNPVLGARMHVPASCTRTSQCVWRVQVIPDIRQRTELELVGTPLTHQHYLRRYKGTYGPAISAKSSSFPRATTPVPGLLGCGDSYLPGIGVPAAAASGMIAANTLVSVPEQMKLLMKMNV